MAVEAHVQREEVEWRRAAWVVAHLLSPYRKKGKPPITPDKLLGRSRRKVTD